MANRKPCASGPAQSRISGTLSPAEIKAIIAEKCRVEPVGFRENAHTYVFFTPHAWDCLVASTHYGKWVAENELESQYFLEGYYFIDEQGTTSTVVTNVVTPNSASQGRTSAQLYSEDNNAYALVEQKEKELTKYASRGKNNATGGLINPFFGKYGAPIRTGFGHTHPNIGVFISSVDRTSIFAAQGEPWITMVVDPRREELLVAVGASMRTASVVTFRERAAEPAQPIAEQPAQPTAEQPMRPKQPDTPAHKEITELAALIRFVLKQIRAGYSARIRISGNFPGKLKFKGEVNVPRHRQDQRFGIRR